MVNPEHLAILKQGVEDCFSPDAEIKPAAPPFATPWAERGIPRVPLWRDERA